MKNKIVAQLIEDQPAEALKRVESSYDTVSNELTLYARIDLPNSYAQTQTFQDLKTVDILINRDANGSLVLGTNRLKLNDYVLERISESLLSVNGNLQITGNLVLNGDLNIHGSVNTYNQDILSIGDTWLNLGISVESNIDGGIRIYGAASALLSTLKYQVSDNRWKLDKGLDITGTLTATGYNPANWDTAYGWGNHASAGYYIGTAATIRALLSSSATGLTYTNTTGVFSLTSGYAIPTTAKQTQWDTAYTHSQNSDQAHSDYLKNNANDTTTGTLTAAGLITTGSAIVDGILLQDSIDRSGLLEINRLGSTGWTGIQAKFSATALWSLMGNETNFGLYDDINIKWILLCEKNAAVNLYYNGNVKLGTTNTGVAITGQVVADGTGNNSFMGNLGVGTENPTSAIHVYSATQDKMIAVQSGALGISGIFQSFASGGNLQLRKSDGTLNTVVRSYGDSYFNGGNLGIGTDTPLSKLDVRTSATGIIARFGIDADNRLTIYQNVSGGSRSIYNLVNGAVSTLRIGHNTSDLAINIEGGSRKFWGSYSGVESNGAADGFTGNGWIFDWSVSGNTSLVIDSLTVRKEMRIYSLEINRIRNTNGSLYVSDAGIIKSVTSDATNYTIVLDTEIGNPFQVGDILRCQQWSATDTSLKYYEITVATSVGNTITALVASKVGSGTITANDILNRDGHTTVGNAREGLLYLTSSDTNSPYMAVVKKNTVGGAYTNYVRVGKLDGVTSSNFGALTGMGFWAAGNAYLEGTIYSIAGKIGGNTIDANGIRSANNRVHFDNDNTRIVVTKAATTTPTSGARIQMYYVDDNNWGLYGTPDGTNVMFQLGSTNQIAGWTITSTSINKSNIELNAGTTPYIKAGTLAGYDPNTTNIGFYTDNSGNTLIKSGTTANTNYLRFASNALTIHSTAFTLLGSTTLYIDTTKVALGTSASGLTVAGTSAGTIIDNAGGFLSYGNASNYIRRSGTTLDIKASTFSLIASSSGSIGLTATSFSAGNGVWLSSTATTRFRVGNAGASRMEWNDTNLLFYNSSNVNILSLGATNTIAGWSFESTSLWSGEKLGVGAGIELNAASKYLSVASGNDDFVKMYYSSTSNWGIEGKNDGVTVFRLGSTNKIGAFTFDNEKLSTNYTPTIWNEDFQGWIPAGTGVYYLSGTEVSDSTTVNSLVNGIGTFETFIDNGEYFYTHLKMGIIHNLNSSTYNRNSTGIEIFNYSTAYLGNQYIHSLLFTESYRFLRDIVIGNDIQFNATASKQIILIKNVSPEIYSLYYNDSSNALEFRKSTTVKCDFNFDTGNIRTAGTLTQSYSFSDKRLKENIVSLNKGLTVINALNPVSFTWKNKNIDEFKHFGFIAQEVEELLPDMVNDAFHIGENSEFKELRKEELIPFLVKAIQEQTKEIEKLKKQIKQ